MNTNQYLCCTSLAHLTNVLAHQPVQKNAISWRHEALSICVAVLRSQLIANGQIKPRLASFLWPVDVYRFTTPQHRSDWRRALEILHCSGVQNPKGQLPTALAETAEATPFQLQKKPSGTVTGKCLKSQRFETLKTHGIKLKKLRRYPQQQACLTISLYTAKLQTAH